MLLIVGNKDSQPACAGRCSEAVKRASFNLANALTGESECVSYFFQRMRLIVFQSKAHPENLFLSRSQRLQHGSGLLLQDLANCRIRRRGRRFVFYKVSQL